MDRKPHLTPEQKRALRVDFTTNKMSVKEVMAKYNVSQSFVYTFLRTKTKSIAS